MVEQADPLIEELALRLLAIRGTLLMEYRWMHQMVVKATLADPVCRRLMTVQGVGPCAALGFRTGIDDPRRFSRSRTVGAHFGMRPKRFQSGDGDYSGRISEATRLRACGLTIFFD